MIGLLQIGRSARLIRLLIARCIVDAVSHPAGDVLTGAQPGLAVAMFDALFASLPPTRSVAAYVDSRGVALAAAGRRPEALLELARAAELAQTHADALPRHLIERHRQRVSAGESISELTDDEDARSFVAAKVLK